jgi:hypothetical protein
MIQVLDKGGNRNPEVRVRDADGKVITTETGNLANDKGRKEVADKLAAKLGADAAELLKLLHDAWVGYLNEAEQVEQGPAPALRYVDDEGYLVLIRPTQHGEVPVPLANFTARIVEQTVVDDGAEQRRAVAVQGKLATGTSLPRYELPADQYASMRWPVAAWGSRAVVFAGAGTADHARAAVQLLSGDPPTRTVYAHAGWREVEGRWFYLHAGGALGAGGPAAGVAVDLPDALAGYLLPAPPDGDELAAAVRASLRLLDLAPERITAPLLGAAYRAVLDGADFALHLCGPTGAGKTELAALAQQHYGAGLDARHLPGSWASTGNSLEALAFAAKDALLVVDDFAPGGSAADVARTHREADRLLRAQGNRSGRARCRTDGTVRPARAPRGTVLSTGEDVPRGQSLRARLLVLELAPGELDWTRLTACQRAAADGQYAAALAGFVHWLAPRYPSVRDGLRPEAAALRERAYAEGLHARTAANVAALTVGWRYFLDFALEVGAITSEERGALARRVWGALLDAAARQAEHVQAAEPTAVFLRLLAAALASGRAHVAGPNGMEPPEPQSWGWRGKEYTHAGPDGPQTGLSWLAQGRRFGWVDGADLYLEPEAAYAEAQRLAGEQGDGLAVSALTLRRRLKERGLLVSTDPDREVLTIRRVLEGRRRNVLHLRADIFSAGKPDQPDQPAASAEEVETCAGQVPAGDPTNRP